MPQLDVSSFIDTEPMNTESTQEAMFRLPGYLVAALVGLFLIGLVLVPTSARSQAQIEQVQGSRDVAKVDGEVSVNFTPGEDEIPDDRSFADQIWPGKNAPLQLTTGPGSESAVYQDGIGNETDVTQTGPGHTGALIQEGVSNRLTVNQQGEDHTALLRQRTSNHTVDLTQKGSNNQYLLNFQSTATAPATEHTVVQDGSNLNLYQIGSARIPFSVRQAGRGMEMVIRHGNLP